MRIRGKNHAQCGKAFSCFQLVENCMMQLFLANHLNPPLKATLLLILYREMFFSVRWFSEKTKSNKLFKASTEISFGEIEVQSRLSESYFILSTVFHHLHRTLHLKTTHSQERRSNQPSRENALHYPKESN